MESSKLHVVILPSPARGQAIPALGLGDRLATAYNVKVTVLAPTTTEEIEFLKTLSISKHVDIIGLPPRTDASSKINPTAGAITRLCIHSREAIPSIRSAIASMDHLPDALILDMFSSLALPIARELDIPGYLYMTTNAAATVLFLYSPVLDEEVQGQYLGQKENLEMPGCRPFRPEDWPDQFYDRNGQDYHEYIKLAIVANGSDGLLINSWEDVEPTTFKALRENGILKSAVKMPVYPIGPMIKPFEPEKADGKIFEWLDGQPVDSVIYVSFGSGGFLSSHQTNELAHGLEMSQERFIWVVRPPVEARSLYPPESLDFLPEGFLDRTRGRGVVVRNWASQVEILGHRAVGGFLTHCGWNSILESTSAGVPMIAWPLYAEQRLNATMLTEEIGVAIRPEFSPPKKVVEREEIEHLVRKLMHYQDGHEMREKVKKFKFSATDNALSNGRASDSLTTFVEEMRSIVLK